METLTRAWGLMLAAAPADDLPLLAYGITAFVGELAWFDEVAAARGLSLPAKPLPTTAEYQTHLLHMATESYPVAMTAMWVVEAAYLDAWRAARPGAPAYQPFIEHWTDRAFVDFVSRLEACVDRALATASGAEVDAATEALVLTAWHEAAFWTMTWSG